MTETKMDALIHDVHWDIDYKVRLGQAWTRFMRGLQEKQLWATRTDDGARTYLPPQMYDEATFEPISEWVQVEPVGTIRASTIVYQGFEGGPEAPYAVAAIEIDGTTSLLMHFVGGVDLTDADAARARLKSGTRVRAVWSEDRSAKITDILHFAPED
ncbi:OB-fold domain-containing protein [Rhodococcus oxybenzonivorans]|uniref:Zn-ribbon domain-containing OB-fold protein n=1 Tax=Rhodococcus oxybenzonivorans TaxID=1990687 RepID=UPI002955406C|nr:OB-fold domain-containing protein [Rhodococcus oxybenzonivorans]MDV7353665.1 OB-fold domain-containing protein [Rhodococcus oxybenzonivorans]